MAEDDTPDLEQDTDAQVDSVLDGVDLPDDDSVEDEWASAMAEQLDTEGSLDEPEIDTTASVQTVEIPDLESTASADDDVKVDLDMILDIPVTISMEIGRTKINIRNLLQLNQGSVVELDRFAGEPLDVFVNGTLIAHGEVVVVNEKFGIRLTDVISANERIRKLK
ncbi:MAG: flagellar motor switch protein FliN [Gammaproteobacteria bacterium]|nr:flagellar motor switch protein FliN [Gammaproteobacteria bacterium]